MSNGRPRKDLVFLQYWQETTAGLLVVMVLVWFSAHDLYFRQAALAAGQKVDHGRQETEQGSLLEACSRLAERRCWWRLGGHNRDDEKCSEYRHISEEKGLGGLYCVTRK